MRKNRKGEDKVEKSKVYFTDMRALPGTNLPEKLKKLIRKAGIGDIDFEKKMTAIKTMRRRSRTW